MAKRASDDMEDGAGYNKLQRPDEWPAVPARKSVFDPGEAKADDSDNDSTVQEPSDGDGVEAGGFVTEFKKRRGHKKKARNAWGCLPTEDGSGSENDISPQALEYLRAVKNEADVLPQLVAADGEDETEGEDEDSRGFFEDGAYLAAPEHGPSFPDYYENDHYHDCDVDDSVERSVWVRASASEAYTASLLLKFRTLRERFNQLSSHSLSAQEARQPELKVLLPRDQESQQTQSWVNVLRNSVPQASQVASADANSLMSLILIFKHSCMKRGHTFSKNVGSWIFAILAALDERTMDAEMAYNLRDMAKKAIWLDISMEPRFAEASEAMGHDAGYLSSEDEGDYSTSNTTTEQASRNDDAAKGDLIRNDDLEKKLQERQLAESHGMLSDILLENATPDSTTKATLDMIITIIGEVYGQRDLLDSRTVTIWPDVPLNDDYLADAQDVDLCQHPEVQF